MRYKLLLSGALLSLTSLTFAQKAGKAYAITGQVNNLYNWTDVREIDLSSGKLVNTVFENGKTPFSFVDPAAKPDMASNGISPMSTMSAAAAYDDDHNKLFFVGMRSGELRWIDLKSKGENRSFYKGAALLSNVNFNDEANNITRMTIAADGNCYALTNDGNHLISFTTGSRTVVTDLGALIDAEANKGLSVHNKCSSWGGDMVADAYGKLYLFTASHNVFTIDTKTRIATYAGSIKNLPGTFTTNGAAVDDNDFVVVSSANTLDGYYRVDMKDLTATKLTAEGQVYNASDLANSNILYKSDAANKLGAASLSAPKSIGNNFVSIYPNPVVGSQFKIDFQELNAGTYTMVLSDLQGRAISTQEIFIKSLRQLENISLKSKPASGMYMIKVTDSNSKTVFSDKIVVN